MDYYDLFKVMAVDSSFGDGDAGDTALHEILAEFERMDVGVVRIRNLDEAWLHAAQDVNYGGFLIA